MPPPASCYASSPSTQPATTSPPGNRAARPEHPANDQTPNPDVGSGCPRCLATSQRRWRWDLNPRRGCPLTRFRGLRTTVHHRPPASLTSTDKRPVSAGERPGTGVNETQTEPQPLVRESAL